MGHTGKKAYSEPIEGRIAIVGVCAAGKSVLVRRLQAVGLDARCCAQEHSYVPDMWRRLSRPEVLIYLDARMPTIQRRGRVSFGAEHLEAQHRRLGHARVHSQIYLSTDLLNATQVFEQVIIRLVDLGLALPNRCA